ncbi:hypothetical protein TIFTF001_018474 [Ficus carica]|uniref:Uncharacterized protein n=1 Tax=Ficus carica TaxID=3494 RepID=A0AA88AB53_FICCA|nr:hypothetical protein TIFTF001_018474 [Ficus carica]
MAEWVVGVWAEKNPLAPPSRPTTNHPITSCPLKLVDGEEGRETHRRRSMKREGGGEGDEVLVDKPFGVLGVGEGGGATLGEDEAQELLGQLGGDGLAGCTIREGGVWGERKRMGK